MTEQEKRAWIKAASNEELLKEYRNNHPLDLDLNVQIAKRVGITLHEHFHDGDLLREEILRRMNG